MHVNLEVFMAGHAVEHDYHLIPPSPWPFLSGCAALVWGLGMVTFFAGLVDRTGESPMTEWFFSAGAGGGSSTKLERERENTPPKSPATLRLTSWTRAEVL